VLVETSCRRVSAGKLTVCPTNGQRCRFTLKGAGLFARTLSRATAIQGIAQGIGSPVEKGRHVLRPKAGYGAFSRGEMRSWRAYGL
jgi:hypothetical protein